MELGRRLHGKRLMGTLLVELRDEGIKARLLLQNVGSGRFGGLPFERQVHPLVPAVLLGVPGSDAFDLNAEAEPPDGELAQPKQSASGPERRRCPNGWPAGGRVRERAAQRP